MDVDSKKLSQPLHVNVDIESEIKGAIVGSFISEASDPSNVDTCNEIFTSSDTVNELIKGFSNEQYDPSHNTAVDETIQVLPSFTKVYNSLCSTQGNCQVGVLILCYCIFVVIQNLLKKPPKVNLMYVIYFYYSCWMSNFCTIGERFLYFLVRRW